MELIESENGHSVLSQRTRTVFKMIEMIVRSRSLLMVASLLCTVAGHISGLSTGPNSK